MVTDILNSQEPIRNKLRTLGIEILSDTISKLVVNLDDKIQEVVSLLDISSALNLISEMNCGILKKEFLELRNSMQENINNKPLMIEEFLSEPTLSRSLLSRSGIFIKDRVNLNSKGHTRIGVQKGSTLMKALSDKTHFMFDSNHEAKSNALGLSSRAQDFNILKKQRRDDIINIIKHIGRNATIKDIRTNINIGIQKSLACSEKTLQRELILMVKNGVLNKTGEKRWSRYFVK